MQKRILQLWRNYHGKIYFEKPDFKKSPCLHYAYESGKTGGTTLAVLNAANEISFFDIEKTIYSTLEAHHSITNPSLETVLEADRWAREYANQLLVKK
ncbi:1-deoxy-D-xylulose 5-phosphate reductoisomerase [Bacillus cereus group sp. N21]|nr:1-deoxy-D-xylulose 5-phosphate reductoisomerase [Bacillus cereus group sp. N21]